MVKSMHISDNKVLVNNGEFTVFHSDGDLKKKG